MFKKHNNDCVHVLPILKCFSHRNCFCAAKSKIKGNRIIFFAYRGFWLTETSQYITKKTMTYIKITYFSL